MLADVQCPARCVAIGLNGPRMPSGASGFMSNVSMMARPAELVQEDHRLGPGLRWTAGCARRPLRRPAANVQSPSKPGTADLADAARR